MAQIKPAKAQALPGHFLAKMTFFGQMAHRKAKFLSQMTKNGGLRPFLPPKSRQGPYFKKSIGTEKFSKIFVKSYKNS